MCIRDSCSRTASFLPPRSVERGGHLVLLRGEQVRVAVGDVPVSYTHLDVYKRQSKHFVKEGKNNKLRASDIKRIVDAVTTNATVDKFSRLVPIDEIRANAVSYTHLDVYKRQVVVDARCTAGDARGADA